MRNALSLGLHDGRTVEVPALDIDTLLASVQPPQVVRFHHLGRYELLAEIARGGMGVLFRAYDPQSRRIVALKLIQAGRTASVEVRRRFEIEAQAAASLSHPNIVPLFDAGEADGHAYLVMPVIEGGTLAARRAEFLNPRRAALLVSKLARAVHHAHERGILHRDIKPGNVLLDPDGEPKLTDFGLAKLVDWDGELTRTCTALGTPSYAAPELIAGSARQATIASDVYGLGALLYELLRGQPPFTAATLPELVRLIAEAEPPRLSAARSLPRHSERSVPTDLEAICLKCLAKTTERRYPTAAMLAADLDRWLSGQPIDAKPSTMLEKIWRWCRRNPSLASSLWLTGAAVVTAIHFALAFEKQRADRAERELEMERERRRTSELSAWSNEVDLQRARDAMESDDLLEALPILARVVRQNPNHKIAAARLMHALSYHDFPRPAIEPLAHSSRVTSAQLSRDGSRVATSEANGHLWIWDATDGHRVAGPMSHSQEINDLNWSDDGTLLATGSTDATARVWDGRNGLPVTPPLPHNDQVDVVRFSHDGSLLITGCRDGWLRFWNPRTGKPVRDPLPNVGSVQAIDFTSDDTLLALGGWDRKARIVEVATGIVRHVFADLEGINGLQFSPDGKELAISSVSPGATRWDVASAAPLPILNLTNRSSYAVNYDSRSWILAIAGRDGTVNLLNSKTGGFVCPPKRHRSLARSVAFDPTGLFTVSTSWDGTARVWGPIEGLALAPMPVAGGAFHAEFSPDGKRVLTAGKGGVCLWDVTYRGFQPLEFEPAPIWMQFVEGKTQALIANDAGRIHILDWTRGTAHSFEVATEGSIKNVEFSPDGSWCAVVQSQGSVTLFSIPLQQMIAALPPPDQEGGIQHLCFDHDGKILTTATSAGRVRAFDPQTGRTMAEIPDRIPGLKGIIQHPKKHLFALFGSEGRCHLWSPDDGQSQILEGLEHSTVLAGAFAIHGRELALATEDLRIHRFDVSHGASAGPPRFTANKVEHLSYTADSNYLVASSASGLTLQVLDIPRDRSFIIDQTHNFALLSAAIPIVNGQLNRPRNELSLRYGRSWDPDTGQEIGDRIDLLGAFGVRLHPRERIAFSFGEVGSRLFERPPIDTPVPSWAPDLAEILAGRRSKPDGSTEIVSSAEYFPMAARLAALTGNDPYSAWGRWFVAPTAERRFAPALPRYRDVSVREFGMRDELSSANRDPQVLFKAAYRQPDNTETLESLVEVLMAKHWSETNSYAAAIRDLVSARALQLAPQDPHLLAVRIRELAWGPSYENLIHFAQANASRLGENPEALVWLSRVHQSRGRWGEAGEAFEAARRVSLSQPTRWKFEDKSALATWQPMSAAMGHAHLQDGTLVLSNLTSLQKLHFGGGPIDSRRIGGISMRVRNQTQSSSAEVVWEPDFINPSLSRARFSLVPNDREFRTYSLNLSTNIEWIRRIISQLYLIPADHPSPQGRMDIEWISLDAAE